MLIAIISDTHDNLLRLQKAVNEIEAREIKLVFHCGDIGIESAKFLSRQLLQVYAVCGNNDYYPEIHRECVGTNIGLFEDIGEIEIDKKKIAITHYPKVAEVLAGLKKYNVVFCGHTHKKDIHITNNAKIINPGSIIGDRADPSFAIYDTIKDKIEFIKI